MTLMRDQLPHRGLEAWKWSDLRTVVESRDLSAFEKTMTPSVGLPGAVDLDAHEAVMPSDPMGKIAAAYADNILNITVAAGKSYDRPLELLDLNSGNGRAIIEIGAGATLDVIEGHQGDQDFANFDVHYIIREGATLNRTVLSQDGLDMVRHVRASITLWEGATLNQMQLTFGGAFTRLETRLACMGSVNANLSGAYLLDGNRHADMTNYIDFATPGSTVRDSVAGVVTDKARGVFQGKFHVRRPAQQTDAEMRHDALMLSDTARINAKPELEIYADDVECAHGNTIGQLDENSLFYMRQRGIPEAQARSILIEAFIAARLGEDETMLSLVRDWLGARV